jgi:hypothetical protein
MVWYFLLVAYWGGAQKLSDWLGMVVHTCNPTTQEAEAGGSRVPGQPELYSETV